MRSRRPISSRARPSEAISTATRRGPTAGRASTTWRSRHRPGGYEYLAICDHTPNVRVVPGLSSDDLLRQADEIAEVNQALAPFRVLRGVECDIRADGSLDAEDRLLDQLEWVQLSLHAGQRREASELTRMVTEAMRHPAVRALSHPKGRILESPARERPRPGRGVHGCERGEHRDRGERASGQARPFGDACSRGSRGRRRSRPELGCALRAGSRQARPRRRHGPQGRCHGRVRGELSAAWRDRRPSVTLFGAACVGQETSQRQPAEPCLVQRPCWLGEDGRRQREPRRSRGAAHKWSQRWSDDPPPGTTVNLGNGLVEIYLGRRPLLVQPARLELGPSTTVDAPGGTSPCPPHATSPRRPPPQRTPSP